MVGRCRATNEAEYQNLSRISGETVDTRSAVSSSSLQLTLENKNLDKIKKEYLDELGPLLNGKTDVIGIRGN